MLFWVAAAVVHAKPPRVAVVGGYPAPDLPIYEFAFQKQHDKVETFDKQWLPSEQYSRFDILVLTGSLSRAKVEPSTLAEADAKRLQSFLADGGTLIVSASAMEIFRQPPGMHLLESIVGKRTRDTRPKAPNKILLPDQPWVKQLAGQDLSWLDARSIDLPSDKGQPILGTGDGRAILTRFPDGKGQLIYVGWNFSDFLPNGRSAKVTPEDETRYESQYQVLDHLAADLSHSNHPTGK